MAAEHDHSETTEPRLGARSARHQVKPSGRTVLVVDDQAETLTSVRMLLEREGHRVLVADSGAKALALLAREAVQLMLVDYFMPVMSGEVLVRTVRERDRLVQIVLQTGYAGEKPPREMLRRLAIQGYHDKTDGPESLLLWVDVALKAHDQLAELHAADRLKTEMLASVSHEFRTPLNIIVGYIYLLREGTFGSYPREVVAVLERVLASASHLNGMVEEFLDISRLEVAPEAVATLALGPFLHDLAAAFALDADAGPVAFRTDLPDDLPAVAVDTAKLRVVVESLLANARQFTTAGEIRLSAAATADDRVAIRVRDTGAGIPAAEHEAIFDVHGRTRVGGGAPGLGLALARRFARLMGGELTVESTVGAGSTFTLVLPAAAGNDVVVPMRQGAA